MDTEAAVVVTRNDDDDTRAAKMASHVPYQARAMARIGGNLAESTSSGVESYVIGLTMNQVDVFRELQTILMGDLQNPELKLTPEERALRHAQIIACGKTMADFCKTSTKASELRRERQKHARKARSAIPGEIVTLMPGPPPSIAI